MAWLGRNVRPSAAALCGSRRRGPLSVQATSPSVRRRPRSPTERQRIKSTKRSGECLLREVWAHVPARAANERRHEILPPDACRSPDRALMRTSSSPAASNSAIHPSSSFDMRYPSLWQHWMTLLSEAMRGLSYCGKASNCASLVHPPVFHESASQRSAARAWRIALFARS